MLLPTWVVIHNAGKFGQNLTSRAQIKNSLIENNKAQRGGSCIASYLLSSFIKVYLKITRHWIIQRHQYL